VRSVGLFGYRFRSSVSPPLFCDWGILSLRLSGVGSAGFLRYPPPRVSVVFSFFPMVPFLCGIEQNSSLLFGRPRAGGLPAPPLGGMPGHPGGQRFRTPPVHTHTVGPLVFPDRWARRRPAFDLPPQSDFLGPLLTARRPPLWLFLFAPPPSALQFFHGVKHPRLVSLLITGRSFFPLPFFS